MAAEKVMYLNEAQDKSNSVCTKRVRWIERNKLQAGKEDLKKVFHLSG